MGAGDGIILGRAGQATVFSTPAMINLMEHAARKALAAYLLEDEESVGSVVEVTHLAATPLGVEVRAVAEVTAIDGRAVDFVVTAYDPNQQIGKGTHRRMVIDIEKFAARVAPGEAGGIGVVAPGSGIEPDHGPLPEFRALGVELDGALAIVTNRRPAALNALHPDTVTDFEHLTAWLAGHADEVRVVILTGEGKSFCAGSDIRAVAAMSTAEASDFSLRQGLMGHRLNELPQPFIAAINGYAFGGGCTLAAHCDFRIAASSATFSMPEIKLGWPGGWGMTPLFRLLGMARMIDLCLTARTIKARDAERWGLVNTVVPGGRLMDEARKLANDLLAMSSLALRENKWLMYQLADAAGREHYREENAAYIRCLNTPDAQEGIAAFLQKRPPQWPSRGQNI